MANSEATLLILFLCINFRCLLYFACLACMLAPWALLKFALFDACSSCPLLNYAASSRCLGIEPLHLSGDSEN